MKNDSLNQEKLNHFLSQNPSVDLKNADFKNSGLLATWCWQGLEEHQQEIVTELKKYQRLLRVVDDMSIVEAFLEEDIHSAFQIAALTEQSFLERFGHLFVNTKVALKVYNKALQRRTKVFLRHMNQQELQSPYVKASRFFQS